MHVLDVDIGKLLGYYQLRIHLKLSNIWNEYYYNELEHLCQEIGEGPDGVSQQVKDTINFHLIYYDNIPTNLHK